MAYALCVMLTQQTAERKREELAHLLALAIQAFTLRTATVAQLVIPGTLLMEEVPPVLTGLLVVFVLRVSIRATAVLLEIIRVVLPAIPDTVLPALARPVVMHPLAKYVLPATGAPPR